MEIDVKTQKSGKELKIWYLNNTRKKVDSVIVIKKQPLFKQ